MKATQFNTAVQKLKNAGLITYIGLMGLFAARDASAQSIGEEFTIQVKNSEVLGGSAKGYKNTRIGLANIFDKIVPIFGSIPTFVDNPNQEILCRIDSLSNGYLVKSYYQNDKRREFLQGCFVPPNNCVLESAQNEVLMENIKSIRPFISTDGHIAGFQIDGGKKQKRDAWTRYYDKNLNLIYDSKTGKGDHNRAFNMEMEHYQAQEKLEEKVLANPQIQTKIREMQKATQK